MRPLQHILPWIKRPKGAVFVEYLLLVTLVGIGVIVGLAALRNALVHELHDLADAVHAIHSADKDKHKDKDGMAPPKNKPGRHPKVPPSNGRPPRWDRANVPR